MMTAGRAGIVIALIGALVLTVSGCSSAAQVRGWAEKAQTHNWVATYQLVFHQEDGDLTMIVTESSHETLLLEVETPGGLALTQEFEGGKFRIDLDNGNLLWPAQVGHPPVWSLWSLAQMLGLQQNLSEKDGWLTFEGFAIKARGQGLAEVKYLDEWTLIIQEFKWH